MQKRGYACVTPYHTYTGLLSLSIKIALNMLEGAASHSQEVWVSKADPNF